MYSKFGGILTGLALSSLALADTACNNSPQLCNRSYSNVTYLGAHDSAFVANSTNKYTIAGNQFYDSVTQLNAGVRMLTAQIHRLNDSSTADPTLYLCHSECDLYNAGTMLNWLSGIKTWLDANKNEVVTLLFVNSVNADASTIGQLYQSAGLDTYGYIPTSQSTPITNWPTLQSMINSNKRLVTWIASLPGSNSAAPYLLDEFSSVFENPYSVLSSTGFSCQPDRPSSLSNNPTAASQSGRLFLMNHFLDTGDIIQVPDVDAANVTNSPDTSTIGTLGYSAKQCTQQYGKPPNYVLVDWFSVGPAISTVDALNGVTGQTSGRTAVSSAICSLSGSSCYDSTGSAGSGSSGSSTSTSTSGSASILRSGGGNGRLTYEATASLAGLGAVMFAALLL